MRIEDDIKIDFKDVLIRPKRSEAASRSNVVIEKEYTFLNSQNTWKGVPIIAANMDTTGTIAMSNALAQHGCSTCLHKHYPIETLVDFFNREKNPQADRSFFTIGLKSDDFEKLQMVASKVGEVQNICIDVANGYTQYFVDHCKKVREKFPKSNIMVGNVCTPEMVQELLISGSADIVKIGIGPGSVCTTRIVAGVGFPQLSAVIECADAAHGLRGHVCADGGCTQPGDVSKAFGGGADFVMLGGMFSGHDECEGDWEYEVSHDGDSWKTVQQVAEEELRSQYKYVNRKTLLFYGMSSKPANEKYSGGLSGYKAPEGRVVRVPYRGSVLQEGGVVQRILGGIKSACAYVGANSLKDLPKCTTFVRCQRTHNDVFERFDIG